MSDKSDDTRIYACAAAAEQAPANPESVARPHLLAMSRWVVSVLFAGLVGLACAGDASGPEDLFEYHWPEDRGIALTPADEQVWDLLAWSPDGAEIFFKGPYGIKAVEISSGSMRVVDDRHSGAAYFESALSADGERVYFRAAFAAADGLHHLGLYSVSADGAQSELLVSDVKYFAVSPDNVHVAYSTSSDSLFLYNVTDASAAFLATGRPLTFSSDGTGLLYGCPDWESSALPCATFTYSLDTQQSEHVLDVDYDNADCHLDMPRWDRDGIRVLLTCSDELSVWNVTNDVSKELTVSMRDDEHLAHTHAWSFDGRMIALWTTRCEGDYWVPCAKGESRLHVLDADGRGDNVVAVVHSAVGGTIIFSPDASRVVYTIQQRIYVKELP